MTQKNTMVLAVRSINHLMLMAATLMMFAPPARSNSVEEKTALPSEELLLFLADFSEIDDETFHLLLERGKQDVPSHERAAADNDKRGKPDDQK